MWHTERDHPGSVSGKIQDAGVKATFLGYGYVSGKKGYRVRINGTNSVITTRDISFCEFESNPVAVQLLPDDPVPTFDAVVTEPANANEIEARLNAPEVLPMTTQQPMQPQNVKFAQ